MESARRIVALNYTPETLAQAVAQHCMGSSRTPLAEDFIGAVLAEVRRVAIADSMRPVPTRVIVVDALRKTHAGEFDESSMAVDAIKRHRLLTGRGLSLFLGAVEDFAMAFGARRAINVPVVLDEVALRDEAQKILDANGKPDEGAKEDEEGEPESIETRLFTALVNVLADHRYGFCVLRAEDAKAVEKLIEEARATEPSEDA